MKKLQQTIRLTIVLFTVFCCLCTCNHKHEMLYQQFTLDYDGVIHIAFVPMRYIPDTILSNADTFAIDSFICCYDPPSLYHSLNMKIMDKQTFLETLYQKQLNNEYININQNLYLNFSRNRVRENSIIKSIYEEYGIDTILKTFDCDYYYKNKYEDFKYIAYLCWQNNIFISSEDESGMMTLE